MIYMYTPVSLTADFTSDMIAVGRQWGQHVLIAGSKNSNKNLISSKLPFTDEGEKRHP